jgi:transaldolase/glucose-6-phosphate isomerase
MNPAEGHRLHLGRYLAVVAERLDRWENDDFTTRLWERDHSLWFPEPRPELTDRLGWLTLPQSMHDEIGGLESFRAEVCDEGIDRVVLLGMGGSSLAPEVLQMTFGNSHGCPELNVLDSTHPGAVHKAALGIDPATTLFLVSSKSGTTLETLSLFRFFWHRAAEALDDPGKQFVAITDPDSSLGSLARERGFRRIFATPPDVGGRYSALTFFGLVPAALIGMDVHALLDRGRSMAVMTALTPASFGNPALTLGAALGELALVDRDKVTFLASPGMAAFPPWLEQLIAESTGKDGIGILPVADEPPTDTAAYGSDRIFVHLALAAEEDYRREQESYLEALESAGHPVIRIVLQDREDLAGEMFGWEVAVAAAGTVLGINPFDQPDVQLAKDLARRAMSGDTEIEGMAVEEVPVSDRETLQQALSDWSVQGDEGDYIAIQAYLAPGPETTRQLQGIRGSFLERRRLATTLGYGPRFLHSTGQLHKGGANNGLFLQLVDEPELEVAVPETDFGFADLIRAQALGDYRALRQRLRRVLRVNLGAEPAEGLAALADILNS